MKVGDIKPLIATVAPDDATDKTVTWTSSDEEIVTVDASGSTTAIAVGTATVTVKTTDGEFTADCAVTVSAKE
ncbi:Ig-like domain-containing protein [Companilactobacillus sp.]|uniref:Ig-like domain-containing protein n=1 Tax=Companilactobacillus sp. TaxID=2767905 RepID=UPI00262F447D|nr:Ig-like domain-containing protein [Companilactobacillus sp.]